MTYMAESMKERYGVEDMSFDESMKYFKEHMYAYNTRNNKIRLVTAFEKLQKTAEMMIDYCKSIPEEDNEHHASLVKKLTEDIESIEKRLGVTIEKDIFGN